MCRYTSLGPVASPKKLRGIKLIQGLIVLDDPDRPLACYVYSGLHSGHALGEALATILETGNPHHTITLAVARRGYWELIVTTIIEIFDRLAIRL